MRTQSNASRRRVWVAGKLRARRFRKPCSQGLHEGPLLRTELFDAAGGWWAGCGVCANCSSTIHISQLRRAA